MDLGKPGRLLKELKASNFLTYFNEELFAEILKDIDNTFKEMHALYSSANTPEAKEELRSSYKSSYLTTLQTLIVRLKRCLLIYLNTRLEKTEEEWWSAGGAITKENQDFLSTDEKQYITKYKMMIQEYGRSQPLQLDLLRDLEPPKDLFVEVRVLKDCGEIVTSDGNTVHLEENTTHFLRRTDVEPLVRQGLIIYTGMA